MLTISDGGIASDARVPTCPKHPLHGPIVRKLAKPEGVPHECVAAGEIRFPSASPQATMKRAFLLRKAPPPIGPCGGRFGGQVCAYSTPP